MKNIIVLFSGQASNLENIIKKMHKKDVNIIATFTNNPNARGVQISKDNNIECIIVDEKKFDSRDEYDKNLLEKILQYDFELVVLAGYMRIIPKIFLDKINAIMINIHPSLLPLHKGLNAAEKSYNDDNKFGGVSVHYVTQELDGGDIIFQHKIDKKNISSYEQYLKQLKLEEFSILPKAISRVLNV